MSTYQTAVIADGINRHNREVRESRKVGDLEWRDSFGNHYVLWVWERADGSLKYHLASGCWGGSARSSGTPNALSNQMVESRLPARVSGSDHETLERVASAHRHAGATCPPVITIN